MAKLYKPGSTLTKAVGSGIAGIRVGKLAIIQGLNSGLTSAAINFAIATAMYKDAGCAVTVWNIERNSLAGDLALNIVIQATLTWLLVGLLVRKQLQRNDSGGSEWGVPGDCAKCSWYSYAVVHGDFDFVSEPASTRLARLGRSLLLGFAFASLMFPLFWPTSVTLLLTVLDNTVKRGTWPYVQAFKAVFGFVLGCVAAAICCTVAVAQHIRLQSGLQSNA